MAASTGSVNQETKSLEAGLANLSVADSKSDGSQQIHGDHFLPLEPLYKLCMKFYKDNVGTSVVIPYQEKTKLLALHKQVTCGKYKAESGQEPGFLDVVGNDRKVAWQSLGDMSRDDAMKEFIKVLHQSTPTIKQYILAYRAQLQEQAQQRAMEEEKKRKDEEEARQRELASQQASQAQQSMQEQQVREQQVREVLNQQTADQFRAYAQTQFPNDVSQQETLVKQLQEQHFQRYVRQVYEAQMQQQQQGLQPTPPGGQQQDTATPPAATLSSGDQPTLSTVSSAGSSLPAAAAAATHNEQINGMSDVVTTSEVSIQEASMWTQKDITAFKNAIKKESKMENHTDCIIKVGSGETVTIRVPTHENGNCLFWEFATDHYDIAFGVYFEWNNSPEDGIQLHISDSSEDEDEEASDDKEKGGGEVRKPRGPPIDEIIPIYRRDSHEEVYCGSHVYPGRGVYLLKFDNSYSLWRSKSLYYRVYYST